MCRGGTGGETLTGRCGATSLRSLTTESSLFPRRDTFVMTMAGRVLAVKNNTRIFRGYFNRKKVRRKHLKCKNYLNKIVVKFDL